MNDSLKDRGKAAEDLWVRQQEEAARQKMDDASAKSETTDAAVKDTTPSQ